MKMYRITFSDNVKKMIIEEGINELELIKLIKINLSNYYFDKEQDLIISFDMNNKKTLIIGVKDKQNITITHISTNPIIVDI